MELEVGPKRLPRVGIEQFQFTNEDAAVRDASALSWRELLTAPEASLRDRLHTVSLESNTWTKPENPAFSPTYAPCRASRSDRTRLADATICHRTRAYLRLEHRPFRDHWPHHRGSH